MTEGLKYTPDPILKDAAKHGELVVFVGAGASVLCGSPDWRGFASQIVGALEKSAKLSFLEAEQLRAFSDPRRTLSIAIALAEEHGVKIDYDAILHPAKSKAEGSELYRLLSGLRPVFVTTNYDKWLDDTGPQELLPNLAHDDSGEPTPGPTKRPKYFRREHLSHELLKERGAVIHLHGSYTDSRSMVVSLRDYIEHYADKRVQALLSEMFKNHTVLFVGYGLAEFEVLEQIIRSYDALRAEKSRPRHFLLYPHRSTESAQTKFVKRFFQDQCGVRVIDYCIDARGYQEVIEVIRAWSAELDVRDPSILDLQLYLDRCIALPTPENRSAALRLAMNRRDLAPYLLNSLKDPVWFAELDEAGFFEADLAAKVEPTDSVADAPTHTDLWPALRYLESVSTMAQGDVALRLGEIVRSMSSKAQLEDASNWRASWSLATIFSNLPHTSLSDGDIQMLRGWMTSAAVSNLAGHEIGQKLLNRMLESDDEAAARSALQVVELLTMIQPSEAAK